MHPLLPCPWEEPLSLPTDEERKRLSLAALTTVYTLDRLLFRMAMYDDTNPSAFPNLEPSKAVIVICLIAAVQVPKILIMDIACKA